MVEVCNICGDKGFSNALVVCSKCSDVSSHQYCLGIPPGSIDDTFNYVCEYCSIPLETEPCQKFGALQSCNGDLKIDSRSEIIAFPEQPEPLCTLPPIQTSKLSQEQETSISPFMEKPNSIMRGLVLLVSPLGEVFIEGEKEKKEGICEISYISSLASHICNLSKRSTKFGTYKARRELTPLSKTNSEVEGSEEKYDDPLLSTSSELTVEVLDPEKASLDYEGDNGKLGKSIDYPEENEITPLIVGCKPEIWSENSIESSMNDPKRGNKRILEAKSELIHKKKVKLEGDDEGASSESVGNPKNHRDKFDPNISSQTDLALMQKRVRNQIVAMLLSAGWTVEYRERKRGGIVRGKDKVYVKPEGSAYWSLPMAYRCLEQDCKKANAQTGDGNGKGNGSSNFFKPLSKELLSILSRKYHRSNK